MHHQQEHQGDLCRRYENKLRHSPCGSGVVVFRTAAFHSDGSCNSDIRAVKCAVRGCRLWKWMFNPLAMAC